MTRPAAVPYLVRDAHFNANGDGCKVHLARMVRIAGKRVFAVRAFIPLILPE
jgi:hypothetical protein